MPKYFSFKVAGYYLYFTSKCIIEAFHVHASDSKLTEESSAKFFVKDNGDTVIQNRGILTDKELRKGPRAQAREGVILSFLEAYSQVN